MTQQPTYHIQHRYIAAEDWITPEGHFLNQRAALSHLKRMDRSPTSEYRVVRVDRTITQLWPEITGNGAYDGEPTGEPDEESPKPQRRKEVPDRYGLLRYNGAMHIALYNRVEFYPMTVRKERDLRQRNYRKINREQFPAWIREAEVKRKKRGSRR